MNTENWPRAIDCPHCQTGHQLHQADLGRKAACKTCGRTFYLLPTSQSDDTVICRLSSGATALPSVGRLWLDLRPGQIVAEKYLVIRTLGFGGLSQIQQVRDLENGRVLALKLPQASTLERVPHPVFFDEAEAWLRPAPHPNLVTCEEVKIILGLPAIFMEYVPGGDLARLMDNGAGPLYKDSPDSVMSRIVDIFIQLTRGLAYAHSLGMNKLDIKPRNIMVGRGGRVLISDYGPLSDFTQAGAVVKTSSAAKNFSNISMSLLKPVSVPGPEQSRLSYTQLSGTRQYLSPEAMLGLPASGVGSDLWAASLTALECFLGRRLWEMGSTAGQALNHFLAKPGFQPRLPLPPALADFFRRALADEISQRPQSAEAMGVELSEIFKAVTGRPYGRPAPALKTESPERLKMKAKARAELNKERNKND